MAAEMFELAAPVIRANKVDILGHAVFHASIDVRRAAYLRLTEHAARGDIAVRMETVPLPDVATAWKRQAAGADAKLVLLP